MPLLIEINNLWSVCHDRCDKADQGQRGRIRGSALCRHARQAAPRDLSVQCHRRERVRGRQDVRRLVHLGLEGHQRFGHGADARRRQRDHRSVQRRTDADPELRRARTVDDAGLHALPALHGEACRGVPQVLRHRRHGVLRSGTRVLHLRLGALAQRHAGREFRDRLRRSRVVESTAASTKATRDIVPASRAAISPSRRSIRSATCAARCARS